MGSDLIKSKPTDRAKCHVSRSTSTPRWKRCDIRLNLEFHFNLLYFQGGVFKDILYADNDSLCQNTMHLLVNFANNGTEFLLVLEIVVAWRLIVLGSLTPTSGHRKASSCERDCAVNQSAERQ